MYNLNNTELIRFVNDNFQEKIDLSSEAIKSVVQNAFKKDDSVKTILLPHVTKIGESAFEECTNLSSVIVIESKSESQGKGVGTLTLQHNCFKNCCELKDVIIQGYQKVEIETGAFSDCIKLRTLDIDSAELVVSNNVFSDVSDDFVLLFNSSNKQKNNNKKKTNKKKMKKICRENEIRCAYYTERK